MTMRQITIGALAAGSVAAGVLIVAPAAAESGGATPPSATTPVQPKPKPKKPTRAERDRAYTNRIRLARVDGRYSGALSAYTGGSYGTDTVNSLWPRFPKRQKTQRAAMLKAAKRYHIPLRLLMGVYGMESGFGAYACYFGLTGYFPGSGTSGNFGRDAMLSAGIFRRLLGYNAVR